jgi:hypothetical protein
MKITEAGTDNMFLHLEVNHEGMDYIYLSLHKIDHEPQL